MLNCVHDSTEVLNRRVAVCAEHTVQSFLSNTGFLCQALERDVSMHKIPEDRKRGGFVTFNQTTDGLGIKRRRVLRITLNPFHDAFPVFFC